MIIFFLSSFTSPSFTIPPFISANQYTTAALVSPPQSAHILKSNAAPRFSDLSHPSPAISTTSILTTTIMDNSLHTLHSITHANTQGSNSSIPSSSVKLGYPPSAMTAQPQNILPSSTNQTQFRASEQQQEQQQQQQKHHQTTSSTEAADTAPSLPAAGVYPHQITSSGGPLATAPFLRDFSLVAEAAKRAQMSVVLRDLESVTL